MENIPSELWHLIASLNILDVATVVQVAFTNKSLFEKLLGDEYVLDEFCAKQGAIWCAQRQMWRATRFALRDGDTPTWAVVYRVFVFDAEGDPEWKRLANAILDRDDAELAGTDSTIADISLGNNNLEVFTRIIEDPRVDVTAKNNKLFYEACKLGKTELVSFLLGQDRVNPKCRNGDALCVAIENQYLGLAKTLLNWRRQMRHTTAERFIVDANHILAAAKTKNEDMVELLLKHCTDAPQLTTTRQTRSWNDFWRKILVSTPEIFARVVSKPVIRIRDSMILGLPWAGRTKQLEMMLSRKSITQGAFHDLLDRFSTRTTPDGITKRSREILDVVQTILSHPRMDPSTDLSFIKYPWECVKPLLDAFPYVPGSNKRKRKPEKDTVQAKPSTKRQKPLNA